MNPRTLPRLLGALALALPLAHVPAALSASGGDPDARYQAERNACLNVAPESRAACLREAGAARQEVSRGKLNRSSVDAGTLQRNAQARCQAHADPVDRSLCERMAMGEGRSSNSVQGGGVLRELEVQIPAPAPAPVYTPTPPVYPAPAPAYPVPAPVYPATGAGGLPGGG